MTVEITCVCECVCARAWCVRVSVSLCVCAYVCLRVPFWVGLKGNQQEDQEAQQAPDIGSA